MIENSKDILYISLSFGVILISVVSAWAIFYVAMILRQFRKITTDIRIKFEAISKVIDIVGEKIAGASAVGKMLVDTARMAADAYMVKGEFKKKGKK